MRDPDEIERAAAVLEDDIPQPIDLNTREPPPERRWFVPELLPATNVGLFSGHGGTGKSTLMLQLACATVLGRDWLTFMPNPGAALVITAEEDEQELQRRLAAIAAYYETDRPTLHRGGLEVFSLAGKSAVLGQVTRSGLVAPTQLFEYFRATAKKLRPAVITIDNAADVYAGSEIERPQVRQFIGLMRLLAMESGAHVLLSLHPSNAGIRDDTGISGSTAWFNSVRTQLYLKTAKPEEGSETIPDTRILEARKNQFGPLAETTRLRWKDGLFLHEQDVILGAAERAAKEDHDNEAFVAALAYAIDHHIPVGIQTGTIYAPAILAKLPEANGVPKERLASAMDRLLRSGTIVNQEEGPPSRRRARLVIP